MITYRLNRALLLLCDFSGRKRIRAYRRILLISIIFIRASSVDFDSANRPEKNVTSSVIRYPNPFDIFSSGHILRRNNNYVVT